VKQKPWEATDTIS